jgi:hypothetical protein
MSDCSTCTRHPCLARLADMLKTYMKLIVASNTKIQLLPQPYTTLYCSWRSLKVVLCTPRDLDHEIHPWKSQCRLHHDAWFRGLCPQIPLSTMEVSLCSARFICHGAHCVPQLYIILLVDHHSHSYGDTHIQLHAAACYSCVRFDILCINVCSGI